HAGDVAARIGATHRLRDGARELGRLVPARTRRERHHDVQALAARRLHEARELDAVERVADQPSALDHVGPRDARARIEIEHDTIRLLEPLHDGVPRVDLENADLDEPDERCQRVDDQVLADFPFLLDLDPAKTLRRPIADVLLVEALLGHAFGTAYEAGRSIREVRQDPVRDRLVEPCEIELGRPEPRVENTVGVCQAYAGHRRLAWRDLAPRG